MVRVKRGIIAHKKREKILQYTKGFRYGRKNKSRFAKEALLHAWTHAFFDRKKKKREKRSLWITKINAAIRELGLSYSQFIKKLKEKEIKIDRKVLAELAEQYPQILQSITEIIKK